jgi:polysaccharide export outer membrane protein
MRDLHRHMAALLVLTAALAILPASAQDQQPEYRLGAGDTVRIAVFQNPDLTLETRVGENGMITFPLIGPIKIGGLTLGAAEQAIAEALRSGGFIKQAQVSMMVVQNRSTQVSVLGQVNKPGRFPLETLNTRLSEMLAIAGGVSNTGADVAIVSGMRNGNQFRKEVDVSGMFLDHRLQDDLVVASGDVIYVHRMPVYYIYGEVQRAGSYRVERGMTVRQALAQGGGLTARGTERGVTLYRHSAAGQTETRTAALDDLVQPGVVLYVKESLF